MANPIPTKQRQAVTARDRETCQICGQEGHEWHHRRGRSVRDEHTHCTCNGVTLCLLCHRAVHAAPRLSREQGFIVSRHNPEPGSVPMNTYHGDVTATCDGSFRTGKIEGERP